MTTAVCYGTGPAITFTGEYNEVIAKAEDWLKRKRQSYNAKNSEKLNEGYNFRNDQMPFYYQIREQFNG